MNQQCLITGGTGTLGRLVVPALREAGFQIRMLSRRSGEHLNGIEHALGDLATGDGIEPAVAGMDTIVHLAGSAKGDDDKAVNLARAASRAGVRHLVFISVIGADRVPLAYFRSKLGAERAIAESGVPWTTLRAAQFHDLVLTVVQKMAKLPVVPVPGGLRFQPVDARDVAARLVQLALGPPAGLVPDLPGPNVYGLDELVSTYLRTRGKRRPMMPVRMPGEAGRAYRAGENLSLDAVSMGERTWEDFLVEKAGRSGVGVDR